MRSFLTTPTRARAYTITAALFAGMLVTAAATDAPGPLLPWIVVVLGVFLFLLHPGMGPVANLVSILAGRPVALTARGRSLVRLDQVTPDHRRVAWTLFLAAVVGLAVIAGLVLVV